MTDFYELDVKTNADADLQAFQDRMEQWFPGWLAAEPNLETFIARWMAEAKVDLADLIRTVSGRIFQKFGEEVVGIPVISATAAQATATFTLTDTDGHVIPEGTQIALVVGDDRYGFVTTQEAIVADGDDTASVPVQAVIEGAEVNDLTGSVELIDALTFVAGVALDAPPDGGIDAEDEDSERTRLKEEFSIITPRPILARDFEIFVRRIAGVGRALALDNYNPDDDTYDNEGMMTVAVATLAGGDVGSPVKDLVLALMQATDDPNMIFHVIDPTVTSVNVDVDFTPRTGADSVGSEAEVETAITTYLTSANYGLPGENDDAPGNWVKRETVRRYDLITLARNVDSVDHINDLQLSTGANPLGTADVTLAGAAPLATPGTINATAT